MIFNDAENAWKRRCEERTWKKWFAWYRVPLWEPGYDRGYPSDFRPAGKSAWLQYVERRYMDESEHLNPLDKDWSHCEYREISLKESGSV